MLGKQQASCYISALTHISASISVGQKLKVLPLPPHASLLTDIRPKILEATHVSSEVRSTAVGEICHKGMFCLWSAMKTADPYNLNEDSVLKSAVVSELFTKIS